MLQKALNELAQQIRIRARYDNFIGGKWVAPVRGQYFDNATPITGGKLCEIARSTTEDIELALDAAHAAKDKWGRTPAAQRAALLNKIADRMEERHRSSPNCELAGGATVLRKLMLGQIMGVDFSGATPLIITATGTRGLDSIRAVLDGG